MASKVKGNDTTRTVNRKTTSIGDSSRTRPKNKNKRRIYKKSVGQGSRR